MDIIIFKSPGVQTQPYCLNLRKLQMPYSGDFVRLMISQAVQINKSWWAGVPDINLSLSTDLPFAACHQLQMTLRSSTARGWGSSWISFYYSICLLFRPIARLIEGHHYSSGSSILEEHISDHTTEEPWQRFKHWVGTGGFWLLIVTGYYCCSSLVLKLDHDSL